MGVAVWCDEGYVCVVSGDADATSLGFVGGDADATRWVCRQWGR
ncbi:MAG: hypothetical protein ACK4RG_08100 [Fimbriimonadales bacterium]